jgi:hypothetical protein
MLDLDIFKFMVTKKVELGGHRKEQKLIKITLMVKNNGPVPGVANATVVGVQNGVEVFSRTIPVHGRRRHGAASFRLRFVPTMVGEILWTASIADADPDVDVATARTKVIADDDHGKKRLREKKKNKKKKKKDKD